jgi:hypothetical protein
MTVRFNRGFHSRASFYASHHPFPGDGVPNINCHSVSCQVESKSNTRLSQPTCGYSRKDKHR